MCIRDRCGDMPADVIPTATLIARPRHRIALDAGPTHHRPQERARVGIIEDAVIRTVSYTHLDVYKRQEHARRAAGIEAEILDVARVVDVKLRRLFVVPITPRYRCLFYTS